MQIPQQFHALFWDVNPYKLNFESERFFIVSRILEKGRFEHVKWLLQTFGQEVILEIISTVNLSTKTRNFWNFVLA